MLTFITTTVEKYNSLSADQKKEHETIYLCRDEKTKHHQLYIGGLCFGENLNEDEIYERIEALEILANSKVDKINGYSLMSNSEINRLQNVYNYDDSVVRTLIARLQERVNLIESQGYDDTTLKEELKRTYATLISLNETNTNVTVLNNRVSTMNNVLSDNQTSITKLNTDVNSLTDAIAAIESELDNIGDGTPSTSAMQYKGTVNTYADLPKNAKIGDLYNIATAGVDDNGKKFNAGVNAAYSGTGWDILAYPVDMTDYYSKEDIATTADIDSFLY